MIPLITIQSYDLVLQPGQPWHLSLHVGCTDLIVRIDAAGALTVSAQNASGSDATRPRPLTITAASPSSTPVEGPMLAYGTPLPDFALGTPVANADGSVSIKKPNGKYLCVTPDGGVEERDHPGGPWESFRRTQNCLIAERDGKVYVLPIGA